MKGYEKWIMIFGIEEQHYEGLIQLINWYKESVKQNGITKPLIDDFLHHLYYDRSVLVRYSGCIDFDTIVPKENDDVSANWVEGGGLSNLAKKIEEAKILRPSEKYSYIDASMHFMCLTGSFVFLAITIDGNIVLDTCKEFGDRIMQDRHHNSMRDQDYLMELIGIINNNRKFLEFPEVPVGILKLPESMEVEP